MFGVGLLELAVIAVVAIIVFGPDRLPDLARQAGRFAKTAGKMARDARDELRDELGPEYADLNLTDLDPRNIVRKHIVEAMNADDDEDDGNTAADRVRTGDASGAPVRELADGELPPYDADAT